MCSKYLQGVAFNSEKSRSNLLRSISNQIATLYSYNIYFIALSLMSFCLSQTKLHDFDVNYYNIFHFSYGFALLEQKPKQFIFKMNHTENFNFNLP